MTYAICSSAPSRDYVKGFLCFLHRFLNSAGVKFERQDRIDCLRTPQRAAITLDGALLHWCNGNKKRTKVYIRRSAFLSTCVARVELQHSCSDPVNCNNAASHPAAHATRLPQQFLPPIGEMQLVGSIARRYNCSDYVVLAHACRTDGRDGG